MPSHDNETFSPLAAVALTCGATTPLTPFDSDSQRLEASRSKER